MDLKGYIKIELDGLKRVSTRVTNTLTQQELMWRPACGCNSMGLILFHVARSEDSFIQSDLQHKPQVWESGKWYQKMNLAESVIGAHFTTVDQINNFPVPEMKDIMGYYEAVRAKTLSYLSSMDPAEFDKPIKLPFGEFTAAGIFSLIVAHTAEHIGEISYLRGLLRGLDK
jgi:hypothetical protein